jgi:hypothetical protein
MITKAANEELLSRLAHGEYQVDARAVAEAMLRRRCLDPLLVGGARPSEVLEAVQVEKPAVTAPHR